MLVDMVCLMLLYYSQNAFLVGLQNEHFWYFLTDGITIYCVLCI
jgi:hypothetical protein